MKQTQSIKLVARTTFVAGLVVLALSIAGAAGAVDFDDDDVNVTVEDEPLLEADNQTVNVTVENPSDEETFVQPIVEIPLQDGLNVSDANREDPIPGEDEPRVSIGSPDTVQGFINESTFRSGVDSLQLEGDDIEPEGSEEYEIDVLEVDTVPEVDVEVRVYPLNDPGNDVRLDETFDVEGQGTIEATFDGDDREITIQDAAGEELATGDERVERDVQPDEMYDVSGAVSILDNVGADVTVGVAPGEFQTSVIEFNDVERGDAIDPKIAAQTGSSAQVIGDETRDVSVGNAETSATQTVEFDLEVSSGNTSILLEDEESAPLQGIDDSGDFDAAEWTVLDTDDNDGVATLEYVGDVNDDVSAELEGYPLGDVTLDNEVTDTDATEVAQAIADGTIDEIVDYGNVTEDDDISAADAMKIQQFDEGERDEEYQLNGGDN